LHADYSSGEHRFADLETFEATELETPDYRAPNFERHISILSKLTIARKEYFWKN